MLRFPPGLPKLPILLWIAWFIAFSLAACGDTSPTARPPVTVNTTVTPLPQAAPPPGWLAMVDFNFADEAERAHRDLLAARPDLTAWASWTHSNQWFVLARDSSPDRLKERAGATARVFPVTYLAEAHGNQNNSAYPVFVLNLSRATLDVKAGGAKEAARLLFGRAINQLGLKSGLLVFCVGDDQLYTLLPSSTPPEKVAAMASLGKLEMVAAGPKALADGLIVTTSFSPQPIGDLKLKETSLYQTLVEPAGFARLQAKSGGPAGRPTLNFELRPGSKLFEYSRANIGQFAALVFDRQVLASAQLTQAIKDKGEFQVLRWAGTGGQTDMQRFVDLINMQPPQVFEAKEVNEAKNFILSGTFTR